MNCLDCEELLQRQLDGEAIRRPELDLHLAECPSCRGLFGAAKRLREGLGRMAFLAPPEALTKRIVARAQGERLGRRRLRVALAAAMMAACVLFAVWFFSSRAPEPAPVAVIPAPPVELAKEPTLTESVREARVALDQLTDKILDNTRQQADLLRDATAPLDTVRLDGPQPRPGTEPKLARPRPGMTTGLQTVAATTRRGLSFMLRESPPLPSGRKNAEE